ncbi:hypothetical protein GPECTOR_6g494 [Gonium pectorale]|uniref:Class II aldolase/adducin N-terminal domain-containing protein n=1 Tax=Gonium pectorale TaxID=33097 RepID=A0A150GUM4_GONPE|nr:hypothetical protein GPECTOR_6g494 [Gonium pectorale]|eukprot:KXZ53577.1 hypothetical protein GPECTOR_6g494 [Gonium pectorale]
MAELITEEQPRIKFSTRYVGPLGPLGQSAGPDATAPAGSDGGACDGGGGDDDGDGSPLARLAHLARLMHRMEELGAAPILNDGQVAGNCAVSPGLLAPVGGRQGSGGEAAASDGSGDGEAAAPGAEGRDGLALVSMSGKPPGHVLDPAADFVLVTEFDRSAWTACYRSRSPAVRPSSDSPLLVAALAHGQEYGWTELPRVVLHGHALAEGEGLSYAAQLGLPISPHATLFSTPEDLAELEALFRSHPYPQHRCYIRRGHGFFLLGRSLAEAERLFEQLVVPWLEGGRRGEVGHVVQPEP